MKRLKFKRLKQRMKRLFAVQGRWGSLVQYRMAVSCGFVFAILGLLDVGFATSINLWPFWGAALRTLPLDIDFAPEVWLSILGATLGTLVIAISIAAQNIPKITELYMQDWCSLLYMWFVIGGACHAVIAKSVKMFGVSRPSSMVLNINVLLPIAVLVVFPYVFHVLRAIQPNTVIDKIYHHHLKQLGYLTNRRSRGSLRHRSQQEAIHQELLTSLNQLETFLEYLAFTEPKLQIIQRLSQVLQRFISIKSQIDPHFFRVSAAVRSDVSFQTMIDQFPMLKHRPTFYEQKVFRLFGNAYAQFLEAANFDLAALCGAELRRIGSVAISVQEQSILNLVAVRFNTMLRFALKHGESHNEARNLYTLIFHYRGFIEDLVRQGEQETAQHCFHYLRNYGNEAYALGQRSPALYFIVNVFAAEMRSLLILVYEQNWSLESQHQLLNELLKVDSPPQPDPLSPDLRHLNSGVRALQISLALFYLHVGLQTFVDYIVEDLLDDLKVLGKPLFQDAIGEICDRLQSAQPTFWEDTDRGNTNLYFTPHLHYLQDFRSKLQVAVEQRA
jgi:hypothetical protein